MSDLEHQKDEILALSSIYEDDPDEPLLFSQVNEEPGGVFIAHQTPPQPFHVCIKNASDSVDASDGEKGKELLLVHHLPPITLNFEYPWDYPSSQSPHFTLSCKWLSQQQLSRLCHRLDEIWEDNRGNVILYLWFLFLQDEVLEYLNITSPLHFSSAIPHSKGRSAKKNLVRCYKSSHDAERGETVCDGVEQSFDPPAEYRELNSINDSQECPPTSPEADASTGVSAPQCDPRAIRDCGSIAELARILVEFDKEREEKEFNRSLVRCAVCFTERLGCQCMRFLECRHAFCKECLRDYFRVQIRDGDVKAMNCPDPDCESQAYPHQIKELMTNEEYERYDKLLLQTTLATMVDVVYCPRRLCQHPVIKDNNSNMGHCPNCNFAFCTLCKLSYHGPSPCRIKSDELRKLREEYLTGNEETKRVLEKRFGKHAINQALEETYSAEWLEKYAKACPYCGTQIQKTEGCNKMTCTKCRSYFCWLCNALLSRSTPYSHFSIRGSPCFERLFEGVEADQEEWWEDDEDFEDFF